MGCKRCKKKIEKDGTLEPKLIYYFYCLSCGELKAIRTFETKTVGYRCKKCGGKTLKFSRHSVNFGRLFMHVIQMFMLELFVRNLKQKNKKEK